MSLLESFLNTPNYQAVADISLIDKTTSGKVIFYDDNGYPFVAISEEEEVFIDLGGKTMFFATSKGFLYKFTVYSLTSVDGRPYTAISQLGNSNQNDYTQKLQDVYEDLMTNVFVGCCECGSGSSGILWYDTFGDFPVTGVVDTLYVDKATPSLYYWDGAAYVSFNGGGSFVPYTGATGNVDLGANGLTTDFVKYNVTPVSTLSVGQTQWNDTDGTLDLRLKGNNVTLQVGQEQLVRVVNKVGSNLTEAAYSAVRSRLVAEGGASGQRIAVVLAQADTVNNCSTTLGLVTENISNNQEGFVTTSGLVRDINTTGALQGETWSDGDVLYLSSSVAGGLTNIQPTTPNYIVVMGYVVYAHATQGKIYVGVQNDYRLNDLPYIPLAGTNVSAPVTGDVEYFLSNSRKALKMTDGLREYLVWFLGISNQMRVGNFLASNPTFGSYAAFLDDYIYLSSGDSVNGQVAMRLYQQQKTIEISTTTSNFKGITYGADYSADMVLRSLIDQEVLKKRFWTKAGTPTTSDDSTQGFVVGSLIYDTTNNILYRCTSNTASAATWTVEYNAANNQTIALTGANVTTTSATAVDITGLVTPTLPANSTWYFEIYLSVTCSGVGGLRFGFTAPSGANGAFFIEGTATNAATYQQTSTTGALAVTAINRIASSSLCKMYGRVSIGATTGVVQLQFASATGGQISTITGTGITIMKITKVA